MRGKTPRGHALRPFTGWVQSIELASWMDKGIPAACTLLSLVYFVGVVIIWFAPETKGKPLPE